MVVKNTYNGDNNKNMSDDDSGDDYSGPPGGGPPGRATCATGEFDIVKEKGTLRRPHDLGMATSPSHLASPTMGSPASSFRWDRGQSFRLYAVSSKSALLRRGTTFAVSQDTKIATSNMTAPQTAKLAVSKLKDHIMMHGESTSMAGIQRGPKLGSGGYADVYSGINTATGELVAIKEIRVGEASDQKQRQGIKAIEDEFALLRKLRHTNVIQYLLFDYSISQGICRIVMEFMSGGSAQELLQKHTVFEEAVLRRWSFQVISALAFIHKEGITHRDIKPANLLLHSNGSMKLADFGCSKRLTEMNHATSHLMGTPVYMAPEFIKGTMHRKSDIWAAGCTILELATGLPPWAHTRLREPLQLMFHISASLDTPRAPEGASPEFADFLACCFERNIDARPEAEELLTHAWFAVSPGSDFAGQGALESFGAERCWEICQSIVETSAPGAAPEVELTMTSPPSSPGESPRLSINAEAAAAVAAATMAAAAVSLSHQSQLDSSVNTKTDSPGLFNNSRNSGLTAWPHISLSLDAVGRFDETAGESLAESGGEDANRTEEAAPMVEQQFFEVQGDVFGPEVQEALALAAMESAGQTFETVSPLVSAPGSPRHSPQTAALLSGGGKSARITVPIKGVAGKEMQLELDVDTSDLSLRVCDRRTSFVVNMTDHIRNQIHAALQRESAPDVTAASRTPTRRMLSRHASLAAGMSSLGGMPGEGMLSLQLPHHVPGSPVTEESHLEFGSSLTTSCETGK